MRRKILLIFLLLFTIKIFPNEQKVLIPHKINSSIVIDGIIDSLWNRADSVSDFVQYRPYYGYSPTKVTKAKLLTSEDALYCLIICYDDINNIQVNTGKLDDFGGDIVSLMLDTFGDKRTAYKFAVTASGVKADCRLLDDARNRDYSWDGIWFSSAKVYDWGYVVEMEIPYRSIQYDNELDTWGLDFDRWIPKGAEDIYWCSYEENEGQRISKFGKLYFKDFKPAVKGLNLEIYPVAIAKVTYLHDAKYKIDPDAGIDIFYNPSQTLTFQLTANPDFAQIEADPYEFNISRYETYYNERRPFFTEGSEIFNPSGRQRNTNFYTPLQLFYSRRIGKKLPDGSEVPLDLGTKIFGRINSWEYGGFVATTGTREYKQLDDSRAYEDRAYFTSARLKKQIYDNSSIGILYVGKHTKGEDNGVLDLDGAFRGPEWQLAYQLARSFKGKEGDFAGSFGMTLLKQDWICFVRGKYIGEMFDIDQIGFVPWRGTWELTGITGPRWYYEKSELQSIMIYTGGAMEYEKVDGYTDHSAVLGLNMQFRSNWGYELSLSGGKSKDLDKKFTSYSASLSTWFNVSPKWNANLWAQYSKTYNFRRDYLAFFTGIGTHLGWQAMNVLNLGTSFNMYIEGNPDNKIEDIIYNARPYFSLTPFNNFNLRVYMDNLYFRSTKKMEQLIFGFLFSYNFLPKSWIYLAINEIQDRRDEFDSEGNPMPNRLHVIDRAGVLKIKYLYFF